MRGEGVSSSSHECKVMSDKYYIVRYYCSNRRWKLKQKQVGINKYTNANHLDWIDENNLGVSHFGINPKLLTLSTISTTFVPNRTRELSHLVKTIGSKRTLKISCKSSIRN